MDRPAGRPQNSALPTERTPLLSGSSRRASETSPRASDDDLPYIGPFVAEMRPEDLHKYTHDNIYPPTLYSRSMQIAFSLCALLYYRSYLGDMPSRGRDIWVRWRQAQENEVVLKEVDHLVEKVWEGFLEEDGSPEEVQEVLWTEYPLYPDSLRTVRVLDFLLSADAYHGLLAHSLVQLSLADTWTYGRHSSHHEESIWSTLFRFVDGTSTPHVLHILDLLFYSTYLIVLGNYLVDPPLQAELLRVNLRVPFITLYSLSRLHRPRLFTSLPFGLILFAFLTSFPSTPLSGTFAYSGLLVAFCWQIIMLHLPIQPSPVFLVSPDQILPVAVLLWRGLARAFIPVVAFFMPGLLVSLFLLSTSLFDRFLWFVTSSPISASPMETRVVFLILLFIVFLFLSCALGSSVLLNPFLASTEGPTALSWDRYSRSVGLEARREFISVVAAYATPYYFPPPLNVLQVLLVQLPTGFRALIGRNTVGKPIRIVEKILWRLTVAPFAFVLATFWLWHLPGRW